MQGVLLDVTRVARPHRHDAEGIRRGDDQHPTGLEQLVESADEGVEGRQRHVLDDVQAKDRTEHSPHLADVRVLVRELVGDVQRLVATRESRGHELALEPQVPRPEVQQPSGAAHPLEHHPLGRIQLLAVIPAQAGGAMALRLGAQLHAAPVVAVVLAELHQAPARLATRLSSSLRSPPGKMRKNP